MGMGTLDPVAGQTVYRSDRSQGDPLHIYNPATKAKIGTSNLRLS